MKNYIKKTATFALAALIGLSPTVAQQNKVLYSETDAAYANTTIAYKRGNVQDVDILKELDDSMVMGDVVRISMPPPAPNAQAKLKIKSVQATPKQPAPKPTQQRKVAERKVAPQEAVAPIEATQLAVVEQPEKTEITPKAKNSKQRKNSAKKTKRRPSRQSQPKKSKRNKNRSFKIFNRKYKARGKQQYGCPKW